MPSTKYFEPSLSQIIKSYKIETETLNIEF